MKLQSDKVQKIEELQSRKVEKLKSNRVRGESIER